MLGEEGVCVASCNKAESKAFPSSPFCAQPHGTSTSVAVVAPLALSISWGLCLLAHKEKRASNKRDVECLIWTYKVINMLLHLQKCLKRSLTFN